MHIKKLLISLFVCSLIAIIVFIYMTSKSDYSDREAVLRSFSCVEDIRPKIESLLLTANKISSIDVANFSPELARCQIDYFDISNDGRITVYNERRSVFMVYIPKIENHNISWACIGGPHKLVPTACRLKESVKN
jgi:hypothetical protein